MTYTGVNSLSGLSIYKAIRVVSRNVVSICIGRDFFILRGESMKNILMLLIMMIILGGCVGPEVSSLEDELLYDYKIVAGVSPDYPPFQSINSQGEVIGFEVDLLSDIIEIINRNNNLNLEVEYRQMAFEMLVSSIHTRQVDVGSSGFTYSAQRDAEFSETFFNSEQIVIVNPDSDIKIVKDLEGRKVGVGLGTTGEEAINDIKDIKITNSEYPIMFTALKSGSLDAVVSDLVVGNNYIKEMGFIRLEEPVAIEEMKFIFRHNLRYLDKEFDKAIIEYVKSKEYKELLERWGLEND